MFGVGGSGQEHVLGAVQNAKRTAQREARQLALNGLEALHPIPTPLQPPPSPHSDLSSLWRYTPSLERALDPNL
jgi:hypothetical protein